MRFKDFHEERWFWATIGGGANPGETPLETALREAREETGLTDLELGPVVGYGDIVLKGPDGEPTLMQESYVVMKTRGGALSRAGWDELERKFVSDMRWWTRDEIAASAEKIYPERIAELLPDILAGRYPASPIILSRAS